MPVLNKNFPNVTFVITTHSPFVLRSLDRRTSRVARLPDGELFETDFSAWQIDDILDAVFQVSTPWTVDVRSDLERLEELARDPASANEAFELFRSLKARSSDTLSSECRRIVALYGSPELNQKIAAESARPANPDQAGT